MFIDKNAAENAPNYAISNEKFKNFLGRGHGLIPKSHPLWEGGHTPTPLGAFGAAFGASNSAPLVLQPRCLRRLGLVSC